VRRNNLGEALWRLGGRESGTARLEEAVAAYRAALEERTRARVPLDWAMTQMNLVPAVTMSAKVRFLDWEDTNETYRNSYPEFPQRERYIY
jgi:hypothetical protein